MNTEPTTEELKAQIEDLKRQLALALDTAVGRSKPESDADRSALPIIAKSGGVWMMRGKPCQSCAREIAEIAMLSMGLDATDFRLRDKVIMAISDKLGAMLDAAVGRAKPESDAQEISAFAAIRRTKYPHEYAGWNVERDSPKWTSDRLFAAPVPLETLVSELNKVAARETNIWAVVYPQDAPSRQ